MTGKQNQVLSFLEEDLQKVEKKDSVATIVEKIEGKGFQRKELEKLKDCCEAKYNDSVGSLSAILALFSVCATIILGVYTMIVVSDNVAVGAVQSIIFIIIIVILVIAFAPTLCKINNDNIKLRNCITAVNLALLEKE